MFSAGDVPATEYPALSRSVARKFELKPLSEQLEGFAGGVDLISQKYSSGAGLVCLEWDNWLGFIATSEDDQSEELIKRIALHLCPGVDCSEAP